MAGSNPTKASEDWQRRDRGDLMRQSDESALLRGDRVVHCAQAIDLRNSPEQLLREIDQCSGLSLHSSLMLLNSLYQHARQSRSHRIVLRPFAVANSCQLLAQCVSREITALLQ